MSAGLITQRSLVQIQPPLLIFTIIKRELKKDKELAELIGILLGDGTVGVYPSKKYSTHYELKITLDKLYEQEYIIYVYKLLKKVLNEEAILKHRKESGASDLFIFKKEIVTLLIELGLKNSPKWKRAIIPKEFVNKKLGKYVLRGYFDTDGTVALTNNNGTLYPRLEMKISPSPMQKQLQQILDYYDFKYGTYQIGKDKVRIQMNGKEQLLKWKKRIGFSNFKHQSKAEYYLNHSIQK